MIEFFNSFFNSSTIIPKINYENIQDIINNKNKDNIIIINTLNNNLQNILLPFTLESNAEENIVNDLINKGLYNKKIIIYGSNCNDNSVIKKYIQLKKYGFHNIYIYSGGLFEWLLLQDIYGKKLFPTTNFTLDILKYKPQKKIDI